MWSLSTSAAAAYYASGAPPSANYCLQADFNRVTQISNNVSIIIGMDTATDAGLLLRGNDTGTTFQWEVIDRAGGSNTLLTSSSSNQPAIRGAAITMKMCRNGSSVTVFANGVQDTVLTCHHHDYSGREGGYPGRRAGYFNYGYPFG